MLHASSIPIPVDCFGAKRVIALRVLSSSTLLAFHSKLLRHSSTNHSNSRCDEILQEKIYRVSRCPMISTRASGSPTRVHVFPENRCSSSFPDSHVDSGESGPNQSGPTAYWELAYPSLEPHAKSLDLSSLPTSGLVLSQRYVWYMVMADCAKQARTTTTTLHHQLAQCLSWSS